jgi:guanine deaminase
MKILISAPLLNPVSDNHCDYFHEGAIVVDLSLKSSQILAVGPYSSLKNAYNGLDELALGDYLVLPTFFDMHFHWVQDDVRLMPKDLLLEWLDKYTFPTEKKFAEYDFAKLQAEKFFKRLTKQGIAAGLCYSSIHDHALELAMKYAVGEFAIGNVLMDMNSPTDYMQTKEEAISLVEKFSKRYQSRYALTPRFAPTTSPSVMKRGAELAQQYNCFIQTHLSENENEIAWVLDIYRNFQDFSEIKSYTQIYERCGLLGPRCFMGHAIHLNSDELEMLSKTKTVLVHCPTSNAPIDQQGLGSGLFDFNKAEQFGIDWVLGSDIGGGPYLSMFDVMESFVRQHNTPQASYTKAFYRSTLHAAKTMNLAHRLGNFAPGKQLNFSLIKRDHSSTNGSAAESIFKSLLSKRWSQRASYEEMLEATIIDGRVEYSTPDLVGKLQLLT